MLNHPHSFSVGLIIQVFLGKHIAVMSNYIKWNVRNS